MSIKWEKKDGTNEGKLTFEIAPEKIKEGLNSAFNRVKKSLNVPGFRKGKVPRQIFNKMYGEEALYQEVLKKQILILLINHKLMLNQWNQMLHGY